MAFTRATIRNLAKESGVELPKELEDALVSEHLTARDAYADEQVKAELAKQPEQKAVNVKDSEEYKTLKKSFDDYKAEIANKQAKEAKEKAVRAFYESKGITGKNLEIAMRGSRAEIDGIELDGDKIKDDSTLDALVKGDFSGLVATTTKKGADTANPPANNGGDKLTKADIYKKDDKGRYVRSPAERQKALAEMPNLRNRKETNYGCY